MIYKLRRKSKEVSRCLKYSISYTQGAPLGQCNCEFPSSFCCCSATGHPTVWVMKRWNSDRQMTFGLQATCVTRPLGGSGLHLSAGERENFQTLNLWLQAQLFRTAVESSCGFFFFFLYSIRADFQSASKDTLTNQGTNHCDELSIYLEDKSMTGSKRNLWIVISVYSTAVFLLHRQKSLRPPGRSINIWLH